MTQGYAPAAVHSCSALGRKDYAAAAEHFSLAVTLNPLHIESWFSMGYAYVKVNEWEKALKVGAGLNGKALIQALGKPRQLCLALFTWCCWCCSRTWHIMFQKRSCAVGCKCTCLQLGFGNCRFLMCLKPQTLNPCAVHVYQAFTRVTQQDPDHGEAWNNIAALWTHLGRFKEAFSALSHCVKHKRDSWQVSTLGWQQASVWVGASWLQLGWPTLSAYLLPATRFGMHG